MNPTLSLFRVSALSLALLSSSVVVADSGAGASAGAAQAAAFNGRYTSAATDAEKKARKKVVEATVKGFPEAFQTLAAERLELKTHIPSWIEIKQAGSKVTFHFEGRPAEVCTLGGSVKGKDPEGKDATFEARSSGDTLVQSVTTEDGKRVNTIKVLPDGSLKLAVELSSVNFKTPIRYTLSFAKAK